MEPEGQVGHGQESRVGDAVEGGSQRFAGLGSGGRFDEGCVALGDPFERRSDETVLVLKVVGGEAECDPRFSGDGSHGHAGDAVAGEHCEDRLEDAFPLVGRGVVAHQSRICWTCADRPPSSTHNWPDA